MYEVILFEEERSLIHSSMKMISESKFKSVDFFEDFSPYIELETIQEDYKKGDIRSAGILISLARWSCGYHTTTTPFIPYQVTLNKLLFLFPEAKDYVRVGSSSPSRLVKNSISVIDNMLNLFSRPGIDRFEESFEDPYAFYLLKEFYNIYNGYNSYIPSVWLDNWDNRIGEFNTIAQSLPSGRLRNCIRCDQLKKKNDICPVCGFTPSVIKNRRVDDPFYEANLNSGV